MYIEVLVKTRPAKITQSAMHFSPTSPHAFVLTAQTIEEVFAGSSRGGD